MHTADIITTTHLVISLFIINPNQMHQFPKFTPGMKLYIFRTVPLLIIRSSFTVHSALVYVPSWSCSKAVFKPAWHIAVPRVQWINSWWWAEELSETCRVSYRSKFGKLVHLVGFIIKKFVTIHGHVNVKLVFIVSLYVPLALYPIYWKRKNVKYFSDLGTTEDPIVLPPTVGRPKSTNN